MSTYGRLRGPRGIQRGESHRKGKYTCIYMNKKKYYIHNVVWETFHGPVEEGKEILHDDSVALNPDDTYIKLEGNLITTNNITFTPESYTNSENVSLVDALRELGYNDFLLALYDFDYSELDLDNDDQLYVVSKGDSELDVNVVKVHKNYNIEFSAALGFDFNALKPFEYINIFLMLVTLDTFQLLRSELNIVIPPLACISWLVQYC